MSLREERPIGQEYGGRHFFSIAASGSRSKPFELLVQREHRAGCRDAAQRVLAEREQWLRRFRRESAGKQYGPAKRPAKAFESAHHVNGGTDRREIQPIGCPYITPQHLSDMQRHAERQRRQALCGASAIEVVHAGTCGSNRAKRRVACSGGVPLSDREDREHAVAYEFQYFAAESVHRAGYPVEPGVERGDYILGIGRFRQFREAPKIGVEQGRPDNLSQLATQAASQYLGRAAPTEIGLQQRSQVERAAKTASGEAAKRATSRSSSNSEPLNDLFAAQLITAPS
jgi:hypothetical protein